MSMEAPQPAEQMGKDCRLYGILSHLLALTLFIGVPFGNIIGPLVVWLIKKDECPFVDDQGKESLNFQISMMLYALVSVMLIVTIVITPVIIIYDLVMIIIASVQASNCVRYRYPLTIKFIK